MNSNKFVEIIKLAFKNEAFIFIIGKYFSYCLQFLNAILIAKILGPYEFGIYGFVLLVVGYIRYINPGAHYAVNVELATHDRQNIKQANNIASNGLIISLASAVFLVIFAMAIYFSDTTIFPKYEFNNYLFLTVLICIVIIVNLFFVNVFRSYSKFYQILGYLFFPQLFLFIMLFAAPDENKVSWLFYGFLSGHLLACIFFLAGYPLKLKLILNFQLQNVLFRRGIALAFYNASFYFIMISSRTIVSIFYDVESLGLYSFANSVAQAAILILGVVGFVFFPKILNRLKGNDLDGHETISLLKNIRQSYISASYFIVFAVIVVYAFLMVFMEQYKASELAFLFLILMQLLISKVFGYSHILIARGYEAQIAKYAFITVLINIGLSLGLIYLFAIDFSGVALCTFLSVFFYVYRVIYKGRLILNENTKFFVVLKEIFPLRFIIPLCALIFEKVFIDSLYTSVFPFILLLLMNYRVMKETLMKFLKLISNKNTAKF
jgi:O-antigen/teichoic acid export membrane protein